MPIARNAEESDPSDQAILPVTARFQPSVVSCSPQQVNLSDSHEGSKHRDIVTLLLFVAACSREYIHTTNVWNDVDANYKKKINK